MREVEISVRDAASLPAKQVGPDLMRAAFGPGKPLADPEALLAKEEILAHLYAGAMSVFRNSTGHRRVQFADATTAAAKVVIFANLLLRLLDQRVDLLGIDLRPETERLAAEAKEWAPAMSRSCESRRLILVGYNVPSMPLSAHMRARTFPTAAKTTLRAVATTSNALATVWLVAALVAQRWGLPARAGMRPC